MKPLAGAVVLMMLASVICCADEVRDEVAAIRKCGAEAAGFFEFLFGTAEKTDRDGMTTIAKYRYHYNRQKSTCYMLTRVNYFNSQRVNIYSEELIDLNQKYSMGGYAEDLAKKELANCTVGAAACESKFEFEMLIRPFMNE